MKRERMALPRTGGPSCRLKGNRSGWRSATTTRCSGVARGASRGRHQEGLPQEGDGAPSRPQPPRPEERGALQGGQRGLRRPEGRRRRRRPTTASAMPPSRTARGAGAGAGRGGPDFASAFSDVFDDLFGDFMGGGARRAARPARGARLGPALQPPADARGGLPRQAGDDHRAVERRLRGLPRHRRRGRRRALDLPDLLGARQGAGAAGLLHRRAHLPDLRRPRPDHQEPLPVLRRRRPGAQGPHAQRQHPGRASRPARASGSPARARPGCAAGRRATSTSSSRSSRTRSSSATTRTSTAASRSAMTTAALGGEIDAPTLDGGKTRVKVPAGRAVGQAAAPARQGHAGAARRRARATSTSSSRSRRR